MEITLKEVVSTMMGDLSMKDLRVRKSWEWRWSIFHHLVYLGTWRMFFVAFLECICAC